MKKVKCIFGVTLLLLITITSVAWAGSYRETADVLSVAYSKTISGERTEFQAKGTLYESYSVIYNRYTTACYMDVTVKNYHCLEGIIETKYNVGTKAVGASVATESVSRDCEEPFTQIWHLGTCYQSPYQMQVVDEYEFYANQSYE